MKTILLFTFLIGFYFDSHSQTGEWTWMNGDSVLGAGGNFGIQGVADPNNSPPALYECCEWKDLNGNFWIFGGQHIGEYNDLWKFDPVLNMWTWMKGPGTYGVPPNYGSKGVPSVNNLPQARDRGALSWTDKFNNLWLYGSDSSNDLWKYEIATNQWTWMHGSSVMTQLAVWGNLQIADSLNTPGDRWENAVSWTDASGNLWLFGGVGTDNTSLAPYYNDIWKYDIITNEWTWMSGPNYRDDPGYYGTKGAFSAQSRPHARTSYSRWKDTLDNFYLFAGFYFDYGILRSIGLNDVWKYNTTTNQWAWIGGDTIPNSTGYYSSICSRDSNNIPFNSFENRATAYDSLGNVWIFGGGGYLPNNFNAPIKNELWHYSMYSNQWVLIDTNQNLHWGIKGVPDIRNYPARSMGGVAWLDADHNLWLFGGCDSMMTDISYNAMWKYTPNSECLTTAVDEKLILKDISIFPNPFTDKINIKVEGMQDATAVIDVYDLQGKKVFSTLAKLSNSNYQISFDHLSPGTYFLFFSCSDKKAIRKLIKM